MRIAILQPNYIPWKGVFDIIHAVDTFVFLDDVQYTPRDWRNRNKVRTPDGGTSWLSVPVRGGREQRICNVEIDQQQKWQDKHSQTLLHCYSRTPFYARYGPRFYEIISKGHRLLADLDIELMREICGWLDLTRNFLRSSEMSASGTRDDRLIDICKKAGADRYLSGPSARAYIRPEKFADAGIGLAYHDYAGYPEYPQIAQPFQHGITILDLLFAVGPAAAEYIWGSRRMRPLDRQAGSL